MAQVAGYMSDLPPTPPPPIYSQHHPSRTLSPHAPTTPDDLMSAGNAQRWTSRPTPRKTVLVVSDRDPPNTVVRVHSPANELVMESYRYWEDQRPGAVPVQHTLHKPTSSDRLSPSPLVQAQKPVLLQRSSNAFEPPHRRAVSDFSQPSFPGTASSSRVPSSSDPAMSEQDGTQQTPFQPLQYHHQALEDEIIMLGKRTSKMTLNSTTSDPQIHQDLRHSMYGRNLQRPDSGFSSTSDPRGRTHSPQLSPNNHTRTVSAHSRGSPDIRPLSYVDLLNTPYPQPAPTGTGFLLNAKLRDVVGSNASLLSKQKTLQMYAANIKKTTDLGAQYEFAVFLVNAAQKSTLEDGDVSESEVSETSNGSIQNDLIKEAKQILQRLADRSSFPFAQYYLADGYASGLFSKGREDHDRAFPLFLAASKHGHAEAMYRTALCYEYGWGCRVDAAKAIQFFQLAASKNHPGGMLRLGRACLMGDMGLGRKYREGIRWMKRAAESADDQYNSAPYELGLLHESGYGDDIFKDEAYSAQLFTKSADLGHVEANYRLGDAYEHGVLSCPRDPALSVHFYTGAAQRGNPQAQFALCAWYMAGAPPVLEKDEDEAYEWAKQAAELGLAKAQYTVGYFTEVGIGCRRDPLEANVWYVSAADQGDQRAIHRLAAIRAAATGADPAEAAAEKPKKGKLTQSKSAGNIGIGDTEKTKKRFGIF